MEIRQLKYFVAVAETLSFSLGAKNLFITQGTLSQQIRQLEAELDCELFKRKPHSVQLTETGQELLPLAKQTLETANSCLQRATDLKEGLAGTLNIGLTHSFSRLVTFALKDFVKAYRNVKLNILYSTATDLHERLKDGKLDLIVAFKPASIYEDLVSIPIFQTRLAAIVRKEHPLADRKSMSLKEASSYGIILPGAGLQSRKTFDRFINVDTSPLNVRMELNEPNIIIDMLSGTNMVGILSTLAVCYYPYMKAVKIDGLDREMVGCVHFLRDGYRKRAAKVFTEMLVKDAEHFSVL